MQQDESWTAGPRWVPTDEGLHEAFARVAAACPEAVAIVADGRRIRYGELDRAADRWAARLIASGFPRGGYVAVLLPRGVDLIVALLGVLKAGGAYALLDPLWPTDYTAEVLDRLDAACLVAPPSAAPVRGARRWWPEPGPVPTGFRPVPARGDDPCCVFFTSGTSGRPKGVVSPHRATARLFHDRTFARFAPDTVVPLAAPSPWDAFSLELWSVLLTGGTSVITPEPYLSADFLRDGVPRHGIDTVWLAASVFNLVVDEDPAAFTGLRQVMVGGERLSVSHVRRFLRRHPDIALINGYGPVESTVFATTHRIVAADCERPGGIPLGRPVPGTDVFVLDGTRRCAVEEVGEICIAGDGLAIGYLGEPELTAAAFVPIDVGGAAPRVVYRTGDLGVWAPDRLLEFRGRADRQVKIRGHRVEPAEVERRVEDLLPTVRQCRVVVRRDEIHGVNELVAFCVPTEPGDNLRDASAVLAERLVAHQRPAAVVSVASFPLTGQGKLAERALLALARPTTPPAVAAVPEWVETDDLVRLVADTYAAVLGRPRVPPDESFFALGGGSLAAGRTCVRLARLLGRPVPLSQLYQARTASALADWLRGTAPEDGAATTDDGDPTGAEDVPLTPVQLVFLTRHAASDADLTGHCLLFWRIDGDLDRRALEQAIATVHERHEPLRAAYLLDPRPCARVTDIAPPALELLPAQPSTAGAVAALRALLSEELAPMEGDVWRTALAPVSGSATAVFGCVVHHVAFDGWSEAVLARDLADAYAAGGRSTTPRVPTMAEVARQHAAGLRDVDVAAQLDALGRDLRDTPDLQWPSVSAAGRAPAADRAGELYAELSPATVAELDALAVDAGVTRFVVLLAGWAHAVASVTGQRDFAVGVPAAQRSAPELAAVVGCHLTLLCLRMRGAAVDGGRGGIEATARVVAGGFATQDVPFPALVERVRGPRGGRHPVFQTMFAVQDNAPAAMDLPGARTQFLRQPYLDLPLDLHTELWPDGSGGIRVQVAFRRDAVPELTAHRLLTAFTGGALEAVAGR
ncbi:AMP-binding protein [Actinomycetes bacterium KLBMP 9797]